VRTVIYPTKMGNCGSSTQEEVKKTEYNESYIKQAQRSSRNSARNFNRVLLKVILLGDSG
jgi:hypothetical protein